MCGAAISNLHKMTKPSFMAVMTDMRNYINPNTDKPSPVICEPAFEFMQEHAEELEAAIKCARLPATNTALQRPAPWRAQLPHHPAHNPTTACR